MQPYQCDEGRRQAAGGLHRGNGLGKLLWTIAFIYLRCDLRVLEAVAGNGGSAADAQHLVAEFVGRPVVNRPALRAIALTTYTSILTAQGNDFSFDHVIERQDEALGAPADIFLGISTSGNSKNILRAVHLAKKMGLTTVGFSGNDSGELAKLCDLNVIVPSEETMNIQEAHLAPIHIFRMLVKFCSFGPDFATKPRPLTE